MSEALHETARARILACALDHVAFDGWTDKVLQEAAKEAGISADKALLAFPRGALDLVDYFLDDGDGRMKAALAEYDMSALKLRDRISTALRTRIEVDAEHREAVRRAVTLLALPISGTLGLRSLNRTVDAIWRSAGDTSTDFSFYTKRATLAGIYSATCICWFGDETGDFSKTWAFLDRRIDEVMRFEKAKARLSRLTGPLPDPIGLLGRLRYGKR